MSLGHISSFLAGTRCITYLATHRTSRFLLEDGSEHSFCHSGILANHLGVPVAAQFPRRQARWYPRHCGGPQYPLLALKDHMRYTLEGGDNGLWHARQRYCAFHRRVQGLVELA